MLVRIHSSDDLRMTYSDFHSLTSNEFHAAHDVLLHLDQLRQLLRQIWPEGSGSLSSENMT